MERKNWGRREEKRKNSTKHSLACALVQYSVPSGSDLHPFVNTLSDQRCNLRVQLAFHWPTVTSAGFSTVISQLY